MVAVPVWMISIPLISAFSTRPVRSRLMVPSLVTANSRIVPIFEPPAAATASNLGSTVVPSSATS